MLMEVLNNMDFAIVESIINNPLVIHGLVGVARSLMGYAENCAAAKKLLPFEFGKLFESILRVGVESFSLSAVGLPIGSALVADMGLFALTKDKK
jgi:hypothetical protein